MPIVKAQCITPVPLRIAKCYHRVEESLFLEVEKPTVGRLQLMSGESALQTQQFCRLWNVARD